MSKSLAACETKYWKIIKLIEQTNQQMTFKKEKQVKQAQRRAAAGQSRHKSHGVIQC